MSKFSDPFDIKITPFYRINEVVPREEVENMDSTDLGGINRREGFEENPNNTQAIIYGGVFNWQMYSSDRTLVNVQLMRLWCTQMFVQIAKGKAFTNETDAGVDVILTDEENEQLENIAKKVFDSLHKELHDANEAFTVKRKPKKLEF